MALQGQYAGRDQAGSLCRTTRTRHPGGPQRLARARVACGAIARKIDS